MATSGGESWLHSLPRLSSAVLGSVIVLAACGGGGDDSTDELSGSGWEMTSVLTGESLLAADPTTIATVVLEDGTAAGSDGCNRYRFDYSVHGESISFDGLALTGSACESDHGDQGEAFISAMQKARRFDISHDALELADEDGSVVMRLRPATDLPLVWVSFLSEGFAVDGGGLVSPLTGISLAFSPDGTLAGVTGCNQYSAKYRVDGRDLVVEGLSYTEKACSDPPGVMEEELAYFSVMERTRAFITTLTGLTLLDADESILAEYRFGGRIR